MSKTATLRTVKSALGYADKEHKSGLNNKVNSGKEAKIFVRKYNREERSKPETDNRKKIRK